MVRIRLSIFELRLLEDKQRIGSSGKTRLDVLGRSLCRVLFYWRGCKRETVASHAWCYVKIGNHLRLQTWTVF